MDFESQLIGVMVDDCWVLGWRATNDQLIFDIEASLWPGHPNYEPPKPDHWACYKRAQLIFSGVREVVGLLPMSEAKSTTDPDGSVDYDSIDSLEQTNGGFSISGEFGDVFVSANAMQLVVLAEA